MSFSSSSRCLFKASFSKRSLLMSNLILFSLLFSRSTFSNNSFCCSFRELINCSDVVRSFCRTLFKPEYSAICAVFSSSASSFSLYSFSLSITCCFSLLSFAEASLISSVNFRSVSANLFST